MYKLKRRQLVEGVQTIEIGTDSKILDFVTVDGEFYLVYLDTEYSGLKTSLFDLFRDSNKETCHLYNDEKYIGYVIMEDSIYYLFQIG